MIEAGGGVGWRGDQRSEVQTANTQNRKDTQDEEVVSRMEKGNGVMNKGKNTGL